MQENKMLVIGVGEVGEPIFNILGEVYTQTDSFDTRDENAPEGKYDIIHICFGYKAGERKEFESSVRAYQKKFLNKNGLTVIHSTVEPGVSRGLNAVHSPVIGQHPDMEEYIRRIPKMFSGPRAGEAAEIWRRCGLKAVIFDKQEETEWGKLFLTEHYRMCIEFTQRVKKACEQDGLEFHNVYTLPATIYNKGYEDMGQEEYVRPILQPIMGKIGGHCLLPNQKLIKPFEK